MTVLPHQQKKTFLSAENLLPLFVVISLGISGLNLLLIFALGLYTNSLARKPVPTLVQTVNGESMLTEPVDHLERTPETLRMFTRQVLTSMFTWNAVTQTVDETGTAHPVADQGVPVGDTQVTTKSWQSSFAFAEDFRATFLEQVGEMTPQGVFDGQAQSVLNIESVSDPQRVAAGQWEMEIVANLIIFDQRNPGGLAIPFNKVVVLRAVEPPADPLPEEATGIQQAVYQVRSSGLQITEMYELVGSDG